MTSHSPVLVNRFKAEQIRFVARNLNGAAISVGFFDEIKEIETDFEYQGAGEIWFHTSSNILEQWVRDAFSRREKRMKPDLDIVSHVTHPRSSFPHSHAPASLPLS